MKCISGFININSRERKHFCGQVVVNWFMINCEREKLEVFISIEAKVCKTDSSSLKE